MNEQENLKIECINEVLSGTRIRKVYEPYKAIYVIWDNINEVGYKRELIRIGDRRWNTATSKYASANYDKLVNLTKEAMRRFEERIKEEAI